MAADVEIVIDCRDADAQADFWAQALGYERRGAAGNYRGIRDPDGHGPTVILQQVDEPKTVKNRVHVDIKADDIEAEAERLVALGAERAPDGRFEEHGTAWIALLDPEGNEVCVCQA